MNDLKTKLTLKGPAFSLADITVKNVHIQDPACFENLIDQLIQLRKTAILLNPANKTSQDDLSDSQ